MSSNNFSLSSVETTFDVMNYTFWKMLSAFNKSLLPKIYKRNLLKLSTFDKAIVGWKMFVTYKYLDAAKSKGHNVV